ncbi:MAG: glycosyltransferase family 4 protein [Chloroflexota bacterium]|nr:glycosyltransferase family 4 protein [Chloroflexota bacterium]
MDNEMRQMCPSGKKETVALLPWGNVFEDFLDPIGVSIEAFCNEMDGGWLFGYVEALRHVGVRSVIIIFSGRVASPTRLTHAPTGATVCILPAPKVYRAFQRFVIAPLERAMTNAPMNVPSKGHHLCGLILKIAEKIAPYLSTPIGLLARELRREQCDALLCQEYEYPRFDLCVLLSSLMRLPVFATFQGGVSERSLLGRFVRSLILRVSNGLIIAAQSEALRVRRCYHLPTTKLVQIFNPLDTGAWNHIDQRAARATLNIPNDAQVVVWHGRISINHKGLDVLLDAWERICQERPNRKLRLLLVGTGQDTETFHRLLCSKQLSGIEWVNEYIHDRSALQRYLSVGDVYAFASRYEGFPVAPIEAMACGLAVVATDVQGIKDIFEDGEASGGVVVAREDADGLASALGRVLDDAAWCDELGRHARKRVESAFSLKAVGHQLRAFLLDNQRIGRKYG